MAVDERRRHELYEWVRQAGGDQRAATLMELLPPVGWADVATKHDLDALQAITKRDLESLSDRLEAAFERGLRDVTNRMVTWMVALSTASIAVSVGAALTLSH